MEYKTNSIESRIQWCQRQKTQARTQLEREGWQSEVEGLCDALLNRRVDTTQYQHCPPGVFKRYVIGFQDGEALIRTEAVKRRATSTVWNASGEAVNHRGSGEPI